MARDDFDILFQRLQQTHGRNEAKALFAEKRPVYVYGAGNVGKDVCRALTQRDIRVAGFLDRNAKAGSSWQNIPIHVPDDPLITAVQRRESHVVMGIFNRDTEMPPIVDYLKSLGYIRVTTFLELHDAFAIELGDRFWLTARTFYSTRTAEISSAYDLWSDDVSRELFSSILKFRVEKNYEDLPTPDLDDQYFPKGLPAWPSPVRFIDCGAYDGDTLRDLMDGRVQIGAIAAFEPDPINFRKLVECVRSQSTSVADTLSLFPCGVGSETAQIRFTSGQGSASCASESGDAAIQCVALDEALPLFKPTLIKMDIEGAEYSAMMGARKTIEEHRPGLAISVYHRPEHLWTIPLLAQSWLKGGSHYLRMHAYNGFELIYYWMP